MQNSLIVHLLINIFFGINCVILGSQTLPIVGNGKIAFVSNRDGNYEIYTMAHDGSNVARLTFTDAREANPDWSPDGTYIAFQSGGDVLVMDENGGNMQNLTLNLGGAYPSWSPDSTKIAFTRFTNDGADLYIMNSDGSSQTKIVDGDNKFYHLMPTWAPSGEIIMFVSTEEIPTGGTSAHFTLKTINLVNNQQADVGVINNYGAPDWSWADNQVAFYNTGIGYNEIQVINRDGTTSTLINPVSARSDENPTWSPLGDLIVFDSVAYSETDTDWHDRDIYVMDANGENVTNLTPNNTSQEIQPDWQTLLVNAISPPQHER